MRGSPARGEWLRIYRRPHGRAQWRARLVTRRDARMPESVSAIQLEGWLPPTASLTGLRVQLAALVGRPVHDVPEAVTE